MAAPHMAGALRRGTRGVIRDPPVSISRTHRIPTPKAATAASQACTASHQSARAFSQAAAAVRAARAASGVQQSAATPSRPLSGAFRTLLRQLAPVLHGAARAFSATPSAAARSAGPSAFPSARTAFSPSVRFAARPSLKHGSFGPRTPAVPRSPAHGPGLQSARGFASGASGRLFDGFVCHAPLALRAFGKELEDDAKSWKSSKGPRRADVRAMKRRSAHVASQASRKLAGTSVASSSKLAPAVPIPAAAASVEKKATTPSAQADEYEHYFAPAPTSSSTSTISGTGSHRGVSTALLVPLDPDLRALLSLAPPPSSLSSSSMGGTWEERSAAPLLDATLFHELSALQEAYAKHARRIGALIERLDRAGLLGSSTTLDTDHQHHFSPSLSPAGRVSAHSLALRVEFDGYTSKQVEQMLSRTLGWNVSVNNGDAAWYQLVETYVDDPAWSDAAGVETVRPTGDYDPRSPSSPSASTTSTSTHAQGPADNFIFPSLVLPSASTGSATTAHAQPPLARRSSSPITSRTLSLHSLPSNDSEVHSDFGSAEGSIVTHGDAASDEFDPPPTSTSSSNSLSDDEADLDVDLDLDLDLDVGAEFVPGADVDDELYDSRTFSFSRG